MASFDSSREHDHAFGFAGMKRVGTTPTDVLYACACGAKYSAIRCVGTNKNGAQCVRPAGRLHMTCPRHRGDEPRADVDRFGGDVEALFRYVGGEQAR